MAATIQASGSALCHTRSPVRSELRPHNTIHTAEIPKGTAVIRPVCQFVSPNDLTSCGTHSASDVEAPAAPAYPSAMISTYFLDITRQTESWEMRGARLRSLSSVAASHWRCSAVSHEACSGPSVK